MTNHLPAPQQSYHLLSEDRFSQKILITVLAPHAARMHMLILSARLARYGALQILDAGNQFNAYEVARSLRMESAEDFQQALERIRVARAFTPYQLLALLEATTTGPPEVCPPTRMYPSAPTLVLDLLNTFYDDNLPQPERRRLLVRCTAELRRLSQAAVVVVSVRPTPPGQEDPLRLVEMVKEASDEVLLFEEMAPVVQPRLF
jgi:hypothetical protein